jgi:acetyl-CoA carboxylase carboxyl transferase subunit alpha
MWKDASRKQQAAAALRYTAHDVKAMGCVDEVIPEPAGGTQADPEQSFAIVGGRLREHLAELKAMPVDTMLDLRYEKFRNIAQFYVSA